MLQYIYGAMPSGEKHIQFHTVHVLVFNILSVYRNLLSRLIFIQYVYSHPQNSSCILKNRL